MFGIPAKYLTEERQRALNVDVKGPALTIKAKWPLQTLSPNTVDSRYLDLGYLE